MKLKLAVAVACAAALWMLARSLGLEGVVKRALAWIEGLGPWGPGAFIALYALACVLFVPGSVPTLGAGALFGVVRGTVYVSIASTLGATAAFLIGRHLARGWVERRIAADPRFRSVDEAVAREGWKIVGLLRLSPAFPFNLLNYALGITRVRLRDYVLASWIGMLPGTVLYVYLGSLAAGAVGAGGGSRPRAAAEWAFYGLGLAATAAVALYAARVARRALEERGAGS